MGWLKLDDQYDDHEKIVAAGPMAELLDVRGMLFCARRETDGFVPYTQLAALGRDLKAPKKLAEALVEVGRWEDDPDEKGWWVHDYLVYNPPSEKKNAEREAARERMRLAREAKQVRSSADVRANTQRTSAEVQDAFGDSSRNPVPVPQVLSEPRAPYPPDFERFWSDYPRKTEKRSALKAWKARLREGIAAEDLIRASAAYGEAMASTEERFVKTPARFLSPDRVFEEWLNKPKLVNGVSYESPKTVYR